MANEPVNTKLLMDSQPDGRFRALFILSICIVLSMTTWFSATAVIPKLQSIWNLTPTLSAWLTIGVQLGFVLGAIGSSIVSLSDVISSKKLMIYGSIGAAAANLGLLLVESAYLAIFFRVMTGVFLALVYPPSLKLISTWFTRGRGLALGALVGSITLGSAAPHFINAIGGLGWELVVVSTTLATLSGALIIGLFVHEGPFPYPRAPFHLGRIGQVFKNRGILLASLGYFGHMWELYAMWAWFLTFTQMSFIELNIDNPSAASFFTFAAIGMGALGCIVGGILGDRWGRTATTSLMMCISGSCALLAGFVYDGPLWMLIALGLIWGFTVVADSAQFSTIVTELGDPMYVGTALTMQLGIGFMLTVITIWLLPLAADNLNSWQWVFLILIPGPLIGTGAMLLLRRMPEAVKIANGNR
jgi:MFS family permease